MKNKISISLWFDSVASEAMKFYTELFADSRILSNNPIATSAIISGIHFVGINGDPTFHPNPSISMMVICETKEEVDRLWTNLVQEGSVLMPLESYPYSAHYGWVEDKYHINWQLFYGKLSDVNDQKIVPTLMFTQEHNGLCEQAVSFYQSVFKNFDLQGILRYTERPLTGLVQHSQFMINNFTMMAMDGGLTHNFSFNEGVSIVINCENQEEIDYYWDKFTAEGKESMCGWCKDKFNVSWQIVPKDIDELIQSPKIIAAIMKMKKIIISELK